MRQSQWLRFTIERNGVQTIQTQQGVIYSRQNTQSGQTSQTGQNELEVLYNLQAGDRIGVMMRVEADSNNFTIVGASSFISAEKIGGAEGAVGPTGPAGSGSNVVANPTLTLDERRALDHLQTISIDGTNWHVKDRDVWAGSSTYNAFANTYTVNVLGTPTNLDMICFTTPSGVVDNGAVNISVNGATARPWITNNSAAVQAEDVEGSTLYCALYTASGYRFVTDNNVVKGAQFTGSGTTRTLTLDRTFGADVTASLTIPAGGSTFNYLTDVTMGDTQIAPNDRIQFTESAANSANEYITAFNFFDSINEVVTTIVNDVQDTDTVYLIDDSTGGNPIRGVRVSTLLAGAGGGTTVTANPGNPSGTPTYLDTMTIGTDANLVIRGAPASATEELLDTQTIGGFSRFFVDHRATESQTTSDYLYLDFSSFRQHFITHQGEWDGDRSYKQGDILVTDAGTDPRWWIASVDIDDTNAQPTRNRPGLWYHLGHRGEYLGVLTDSAYDFFEGATFIYDGVFYLVEVESLNTGALTMSQSSNVLALSGGSGGGSGPSQIATASITAAYRLNRTTSFNATGATLPAGKLVTAFGSCNGVARAFSYTFASEFITALNDATEATSQNFTGSFMQFVGGSFTGMYFGATSADELLVSCNQAGPIEITVWVH